MTLTELRYIVAVARERHFGRAAEACHVSQPTLSVAVRKLEDELGVALFERDPGEVRVTAVGERVVAQSQRVLEEAERVKQLARSGQDDLQGPLRLGAIFTIAPYLLPQLIPRLREQAPHMPVVIKEDYTANLGEALRRGNLDLIILSLPFSESGIETLPLYDEDFEVLLPATHPLAAESHIDPHALAGQELLLLGAGHCFRDQVLQACPECNRAAVSSDNMQKWVEGTSLETIRLMVGTGLGLTVLPATSLHQTHYQDDQVVSRPFTAPSPARTVALAWRRSFPRLGAVQAVARAIRECPLAGARLLAGSAGAVAG